MTPDEKLRIEENLRFFIEKNFWLFEIDNKVKIESFTVKLKEGAVNDVKIKLQK